MISPDRRHNTEIAVEERETDVATFFAITLPTLARLARSTHRVSSKRAPNREQATGSRRAASCTAWEAGE